MQVAGQHALSSDEVMATGARVSNAYPTFPRAGYSPAKVGLIPHTSHDVLGVGAKALAACGWGCVRLGSRRGNGPPILRSVGVLRGRSPTLVLRHGPDSYGRQQ